MNKVQERHHSSLEDLPCEQAAGAEMTRSDRWVLVLQYCVQASSENTPEHFVAAFVGVHAALLRTEL